MLGVHVTKLCHSKWVLGLLLLMVAGIIRGIGLFDFALDWDEANTVVLAQMPVLEMIDVNIKRECSLPGMPFLLHFWVKAFGSTDIAVRVFAWIAGLLGIGGSYWLAWIISRNRFIAILTGLFVLLSPFMMHYSRMITKHNVYFTLVILSWCAFLRLMEKDCPKGKFWNPWGCGLLYVTVTFSAVHLQPMGPLFLIFQCIYLFIRRKSIDTNRCYTLAVLAGGVGLTFLPELWALLQPWHPAHLPEIKAGYVAPNLLTFIWSFPNLLLVGQDKWQSLSPMWQLIPTLVLGGWILIEGFKKLKKEEAGKASLVLYIAGYPVLGLCLVSWMFQYGMFQFRAVLFGLFLMAFLASYLVWDLHQRGKKTWILLLVLVFWLQIGSWYDYRSHATEDPYRAMAGIVKRHYKPGDGIVIIPGFHYLPFFRYYKPDLFAITPEEQHFDPNRENLYNMVNHIDQDYFFVSGRVIRDSQVLKQFLAFQNSHARLWFLGQLEFTPFFTCGKTYLTIDDLSSDAVMEHRCFQDVQVMNQQSDQHLGFCHRRVGQEQWLCDR